MSNRIPLRWVVIGIFVISSALNYLDRQILTQLAPILKAEFHLTNRDFGFVISAFSIVYAASAPLAGLFIDRVGLTRGISFAVGFWSFSGLTTGLVTGFGGLLGTRAALGLFEAAAVPAVSKAIRQYLKPHERAVGQATSQLGISVGAVLAPPLATWLALVYGWRSAFVVTGLLGLLWIPLWRYVSAKVPPPPEPSGSTSEGVGEILRDPRLWGFVAANALGMTAYTLWSNWTTIYLIQVFNLRLIDTAWLAGFPPLVAPIGGFLGGWLSMWLIRRGSEPLTARRRACLIAACAMLLTAAVPFMPSALLATIAIGISFLFASAFSVNIYAMPLDAFSMRRAAFSVSLLTGAYGAMQTVISPVIGGMVDKYGFRPVCLLVAVAPLLAVGILKVTARPVARKH
jgi:ACS family hexuronate transporter-like MFS transporter